MLLEIWLQVWRTNKSNMKTDVKSNLHCMRSYLVSPMSCPCEFGKKFRSFREETVWIEYGTNRRKYIGYYYLLLSALLILSGDSGVTPGFPFDSDEFLHLEIHLNQVEIQVWLLNLHLISGVQTKEGSTSVTKKSFFFNLYADDLHLIYFKIYPLNSSNKFA